MKKIFLLSMLLCVLVTACSGEKNIPTVFPSITTEPRLSPAPTIILTPTIDRATKLPSTPTFTPFPPYPTKKVVLEYHIEGQLSHFDIFYTDHRDDLPNIVLYEDGQMLVGEEQTILSAEEMQNLVSKLDTLGFFSLESNQQYNQQDKLYNFGNQYEKAYDGLKYCVFVNVDTSKELCAYEPYRQFLIPEMKAILQYLDEYKPSGLTPYYPERILLSIEPVDSASDDLPATATDWDQRFPSLEYSPPRNYMDDIPASVMYIEGDLAKEIYLFLKNARSSNVFIQDGKKYIVLVDMVLPHEKVRNAYQ